MKVLFTNQAFKEIVGEKPIDEAIQENFLEIVDIGIQQTIVSELVEDQAFPKSEIYSIERILAAAEQKISSSTFKVIRGTKQEFKIHPIT